MSKSKSKEQKLSKEFVYDSDSDIEQEPIAYQPPRHFHELETSKKSSFKPSEGKEIWLFKLPESLELKDTSKLPISKESNGTIFKHSNGKKYKITQELLLQDLSTNKYSIFVPSKENNYKIDKKLKVKRVFTISEAVEIPSIDLQKVRTARVDVEKETNLRMRHFPTGYGANDFDELKPVLSLKRKAEAIEEGEETKKEKKEKKEKKDKKEKKKEKKSKKEKKEKK